CRVWWSRRRAVDFIPAATTRPPSVVPRGPRSVRWAVDTACVVTTRSAPESRRERAAARGRRSCAPLSRAQRLRPAHRLAPRGGRRVAIGGAGRNARAGRRKRLREVDARQNRDGDLHADGGRDPLRGAGDRPTGAGRATRGGERPPVRLS